MPAGIDLFSLAGMTVNWCQLECFLLLRIPTGMVHQYQTMLASSRVSGTMRVMQDLPSKLTVTGSSRKVFLATPQTEHLLGTGGVVTVSGWTPAAGGGGRGRTPVAAGLTGWASVAVSLCGWTPGAAVAASVTGSGCSCHLVGGAGLSDSDGGVVGNY